jgi:hypothetical protein
MTSDTDSRAYPDRPVLGAHMDDQGREQFYYTLVDVVAESTSGEAVAADDAQAVCWFRLDQLSDVGLWSETERVIRESARKLG